jgi:hypothetical protein
VEVELAPVDATANDATANDPPALDPREVDSLTSAMAHSYLSMVKFLRQHMKLSQDDAWTHVVGPLGEEAVQQAMEAPPEYVSWTQMNELMRSDPKRVKERWESILRAAFQELQSGQRSAQAVEGIAHRPLDRARYMAVRHELARDWQPRNGIEQVLVDQLAHAFTQYLRWMERFTTYSTIYSTPQSWRHSRHDEPWEEPRVSEAQALETAASMVDRCNRLFMRTLRALRDLRRYPVVVQNAGQVNIGEKQINLKQGDTL